MKLESLFNRCINIDYINVENEVSYAYEKIGKGLYLYFEQSRGKRDWAVNLDFPIKRYERTRKQPYLAHRGFLKSWLSVEKYIYPLIMQKGLEEIIITGYSHGGALAVLCYEYCIHNRNDCKITGYGFGAPRVIWSLSRKNRDFWSGLTVIRNINDIVTHLPPAIFGYKHMGKLIEIGKRGKYSVTDAHKKENILKELQILGL